jgi:hypothetical protein
MPYNPAVNAGPVDYDYGIDFDYSVWTEDTVITLCNVRWDSAYRDVVDFRSRANLNTFIDNIPGKLDLNNYSILKPFEDATIDLPHNVASRFNYIRVSNPAQPVGPPGHPDIQKDFYYFITGVTYESPDATRLTLQLDVYQTYIYDVSFGECYIERGHVAIANANNFQDYGRRYLTVPEGLDIGGEYQVIATAQQRVMGYDIIDNGSGGVSFIDDTCVIIVTTQDITAAPGNKDEPNRATAKGTFFQGIANGAAYWGFKNQSEFRIWMSEISETPWIGESVIAAFMAPNLERYYPDFHWNDTGYTDLNGYMALPFKRDLFTAWRDSENILNDIPEKYRHLKKFLTFPYMLIELTTWTGTPIVLKPELWQNPNARIVERASMALPGQRIEFHAQSYNAHPGTTPSNWGNLTNDIISRLPASVQDRYIETGDDQGDYWDHATKIVNLPSVIMVNDAATSYIAANRNQLAYARESANWDQSRALASNNLSFDNASTGMELNSRLNQIGVDAALLQTGNVNRTQVATQVAGGIGSVTSGLVGGGSGLQNIGIGAVSAGLAQGAAAVQTGIEIAARDEATAISNMSSQRSTRAQNNATGEIRDRNKNLADWAARGDNQNKIAGINAKVNDARMIPPTTSGQMGGETINLTDNTVRIVARWKLVDSANIVRIGDFWNRFGYAVNQFYMLTDQLVMQKATYWKMTQCYLVTGPMPEIFKDALRGVFEKGVTVYANPNDIGTMDFSNNPAKAGITL